MDITRAASEAVKVWITFGGATLALLWLDVPRKWAPWLLAGLTLVSCMNYGRWGTKIYLKQVDSYDVMHYYLSAKYFDELGYFDLYPAILLADREHPDGPFTRRLRRYRAQSEEEGYLGLKPIRHGLARGRVVKSEKFSPKKWDSFKADLYHLQRDYTLDGRYFRVMMADRGFNGTTVWLLLARPIAKIVPATWMKPLCYLDVLWLGVGLAAVYWAYASWIPVLWTAVFLFNTYSTRWPITGEAFLRYDWVALLLVTMALLKKRKFFAAGWAAALPALLRFFPAVWMFGPAARGLVQLLFPGEASGATGLAARSSVASDAPLRTRLLAQLRRRLSRTHLIFAAGFLASAVSFQGAAVLSFGTDAVTAHASNLAHHIQPEELSSRRMGLAIGLTHDGKKLPKLITDEQKRQVRKIAPLRLALASGLLLALGWGARRLRDDEAYALGFIPFFLLSTFSYYYAVARLTLILWHASDLKNERNRVGLAILLALEMFSNYAETNLPGHRVYLVGHLSWGLAAYSVLMAGWLVYENYRSDRDLENDSLSNSEGAPEQSTEERPAPA